MWITIYTIDKCITICYNIRYMTKVNKTSFVIIRVTDMEKAYLLKMAVKAKQKFSNFIRVALGLQK